MQPWLGHELIGLMAEPGPHLLVGLLGILAAGRGFVPLDPDHPAERLGLMIEDCRLRILLTDRAHLAKAREIAAQSTVVEHVVCLDAEVEPAAEGRFKVHGRKDLAAARTREGAPPAAPRGEGVAYVIYTSGSTGTPKGVPITHRNLAPLLLWSRDYFGFGEHTRVLQSLSYAFDFGVFEILTTLLFGGVLHLLDRAQRSDVEGYVGQVERQAINTLHTTPAFFRAVAAAGGDLRSVELLHLGGEQLSDPLVDQALAATGYGCEVYNGYGPTEATINCAIFAVGTRASRRGQGLSSIPIGRPSAANRLYVLDGAARLAPVGVPGELCVGGPGVSSGYLNRPELTAERFIPHPFTQPAGGDEGPGSRLYRTGDLVRCREDGNFEFLGRRDQQVKVRGYRIELGEIEAALAGHPVLRQCAVLAHRRPAGDPQLVAYVVLAAGSALDSDELRRFLGRQLPPYMVPTMFVALADLPLTATGKLDRGALPAPEEASSAASSAAPRTPVEEVLAGIWCRCLSLERVGIHDNFFALGGHSLLVTQVVSQIRRALDIEIPLTTFFEAPTVAELALAVEGAGHVELPPIQPVPRSGELPLSFAQERLWFLAQLEPNLRSYYVPRALRVRGSFNPRVVEVTFSEINRRHEILRTTFPAIDGRPVQVIHPPSRMSLPEIDLSALLVREREKELRKQILEEGRRPFDLSRGPLLRLVLLRLAPQEHVLVMTEHHLVHDGWTQGVLLRDFLTLYAAFSRGEPSPLPEPPVQYADFAIWQRRWLRDDVLDRQLAYWKERLAGALAVLELPADRRRPRVQSFRGDQVTYVLSAALSRALRALSRRLGVTLFMSMLSAWDALLMRTSSQEDLCVGTGLANRRVVEVEGLLGMVINTLVLRADLSGAPTFTELVARMRQVCMGAYAHQDLPFEKLVAALRLERSLSHTPLFQVFFVFLDTPMPELELPGLSFSVLDAHNGSAKFDINVTVLLPSEQRVGLQVGSRQDEITLLFEYSTDIFDRTTILRMLEHFQVLLEAAVVAPELRLPQLPLLTTGEAHQLLAEWNATVVLPSAGWADSPVEPPEQGPCLHHRFEEHARRSPGSAAVVMGVESLTYGQLDHRANCLARLLKRRGVGPERVVGVCLERSPELVVAILGVLKAGGAYLPLDPAYPKERLAFMLTDAAVPVIVTERRVATVLEGAAAELVYLDEEGAEEAPDNDRFDEGISPENLAYVIYTSGSTGRPRGVLVSHTNVGRLLLATDQNFGFGTKDVWTLFHSYAFDFSVWEIWGALAHGGCLVVVPYWVSRSSEAFLELLSQEGVTVLNQTPSAFRQLMRADEESGGGRDLALRLVIFGGEELEIQSLRPWVERRGAEWPRLVNMYGITETTVHVTYRSLAEADVWGGGSVIGRALPDLGLRVLDRALEPRPVGVPGELCISGAGLARGYLNRPELTAARFVPAPWGSEPGARQYRSGDLVRWLPDGDMDYLGRIDRQVKVRGFRIELGEIEAALVSQPGVREAVVTVQEDEPGNRRLVAYVVGGPEGSPGAGVLREALKRKLPEPLVPSAIVELPSLPLTPNGKVDRRALPAPEKTRATSEEGSVRRPSTPIEEVLCGIWEEVLRLERVGVEENFFELGGHSLLGTQVVSRVRTAFQVEIPLRQLFETPTVAALAQAVVAKEARPGHSEAIAQILEKVKSLSPNELQRELQVRQGAGEGI